MTITLAKETLSDALQQLSDLHGALQHDDRIVPLDVRFHRLNATILALAGLASPPAASRSPAPHEHACVLPDEDSSHHAICKCACGATAFNTMGEPEWSAPAPSPRPESTTRKVERDESTPDRKVDWQRIDRAANRVGQEFAEHLVSVPRPEETLEATRAAHPAEVPALRDAGCRWTLDQDGVYDTACGNRWFFDSGTAEENKARFCMYCGAPLIDSEDKQIARLKRSGQRIQEVPQPDTK